MRRVADLLRMDDRVAIVTGGTGHLALAIGEALLECGARVMLTDINEAACKERVALLRSHGGEAGFIAADLQRPESATLIVEHAVRSFGRLDIVINNAAFTGDSSIEGWATSFEQQSLEAWDAALRLNLTSAFRLTQAAQPHLVKSPAASIVNIASIYGMVGPDLGLYDGTAMANPAAYGASKGGLILLTRHLATVLAPRIRVNSISPGGIERAQPAVFKDRYCARTPLRRMATEEDFKGAVAYLASDASSYVTGHNLVVDGGWTSW